MDWAGGVALFDQKMGGREARLFKEKPLMLRVGCGLDPYPVIDTPATPLQTRRGAGVDTQRGLFLALHLHPLPVGGCVNNMATGKINCGQAAGLRGSLCE